MITARRVGTGVVVGAAVVGLVLIDWFADSTWGTSLAIIALTCGALAELYAMFEDAGIPCHRRWGVFCSAALMTMRVGYDSLGLTSPEAHEVFLAGLAMAAVLWVLYASLDTLTAGGPVVNAIVIASIPVTFIVGAVLAKVWKRTRPEVYARIGGASEFSEVDR